MQVLWGVSRERNRRVFEDQFRSSSEVVDSIMREVGDWVFVSDTFKGTPLALLICNWSASISWSIPKGRKVLSSWVPPPVGCFKLNFDGASEGNPGPAGFRCVLRDHLGKIIRVIYGPIGVCDSIMIEVMGLHMGLRELKRIGLYRCLGEGDFETVISWGMGQVLGSGSVYEHFP